MSAEVAVGKASYSAGDKVCGKLTVFNPGPDPVAVAKPLLPQAWFIVHEYEENGEKRRREWSGSVVQGSTHSGLPPRYEDDQYQVIEPGKKFTTDIDIDWYIRNQEEAMSPGRYELLFYYDHPPTDSERDLPLVPYVMKSNKVRVTISPTRTGLLRIGHGDDLPDVRIVIG